jgi:cellulose synthase/poly-beta-1,6-N-acetylglucosamine synthase-like glycosyltransferase
MALDYVKDLLEVMVISDASNDGTDSIVTEFMDRGVRLCRQAIRSGKSAGLTRFCPEAKGDILVFTDANSLFQTDALQKLVRHFDDHRIGFVVGRQLYDSSNSGPSAVSEKLYWNLELLMKAWESRLSSVVGADGAIYALRKQHFEPMAPDDINDFHLPLRVVAKGFRGVFDTEAVCFESTAPNFIGEFRRKYRIVNRSFHAVSKTPAALNPFRVGWFAIQLLLHKVLRWLSPVFLILMLLSSAILASQEHWQLALRQPFTLFLGSQLLGYGLASLYLLPPLRRIPPVYIAFYFVLVNVAAAVALVLLISRRKIAVWQPQR